MAEKIQRKRMNPHILFWVPAILRLSLIWIGAGILWCFFGPIVGLLVGMALTTIISLSQLYYLFALDRWLESSKAERMPEGWGAWHTVYSHLYRLNHEEEKNKKNMTEWLTRFRQAMSFLPDGVAIMNNTLYLDWCNPMMEKHLGLDIRRDKNMRITNLVRVPEFMDYVILGRYDRTLELTINNRYLVLQMVPFDNRNQILVSHDRTEAIKTDRIRRDFIANASYELRRPLDAIKKAVLQARESDVHDEAKRQESMSLVEKRCEQLQVLVNDLLLLTNLESNDYPVKHEAFNMLELFRQLRQVAEQESQGKHHILLEIDGPEEIYSDLDEIRLAFTHLIMNAIHFTPEGGTVTLIWTLNEQGPRFTVWDTGIGIEQQHIPRLTQRFYQVDKNSHLYRQGRGLGLAIVRHVLIRHEAQLDIQSEIGKGSEFSIQFNHRVLVP